MSVIGTYQAYHYTDSDAFCGTACHQVMHPEYTAYQASPHARVGCAGCHIGPGAGWFVRSKLSGSYQVYAALTHKYPRPIPSPVESLRPAQETCYWRTMPMRPSSIRWTSAICELSIVPTAIQVAACSVDREANS